MYRLQFIGLFLFLFCFSPAVVVPQENMSMEQMEEILLKRSESLKQNVTLLKQQLQELQEQQIVLKTTLTSLDQYCSNILEEYNDCVQTLDNYKSKLKNQQSLNRKLTFALIIILVLFILVRVATIVLKFRGVHLPELLNILL